MNWFKRLFSRTAVREKQEFRDRVEVHTAPSGTQSVDPVDVVLAIDLDRKFREMVKKARQEAAPAS